MRYLEKANDRAVDLRTGAMGSLLDKLGKLLEEDYNVEDSIKTNIKSFSEKLKKMHQILRQLGKLDGVKIWVDQVRELSYHIEDLVDGFLVHVEPNSNRTGFRELTHKGLKLWEDGMTTQHQIGDVITHIKNHVQDVADMQENYNFNVNNVVANATAKTAIDLRISGMYVNKEQLIGIKAPRDELIRFFEEDADISKLKTIFIVGMGGLGKTTLAKAVYDKLKKDYHHRAFIPVGQNPDVKKVLKDILFEFGQNSENLDLDVHQLINKLRKLLKKERYFIVIDDIWDFEAWGLIQSALPGKKHGSRVITTTRIEHVARACCEHERKYVYRMKPLSEEESRRLFLRRIFGHGKDCPDTPRKEEISKYILKKCGGMPLAINSIASLLKKYEEESTWEYIWKSLASVTEEDDLEKMTQILDLSYMHLPDHLKTCLLYVCIYPEDREIYKDDLVRLWVAEGFVSANSGLDAEDVANKYFNDLISMSMIQPGETDASNNEVLSCRVHDIMLDLLKSKSSKENFIRVIDDSKYGTGKIRRVSFHYNDKNDMRILETINKVSLSQVRSVLLCRSSLAACFLEKLKYVRVLHLERDYYCSNLDLTGISRLFFLRYLKIAHPYADQIEEVHEVVRDTCILKLPNQIGELQRLETIDIQGCNVEYPSDIVSLPWLSHLSLTGNFCGVALPDGINRLTSLRTLAGVSLYKSSVDNILGLSKLTNLRELRVCLYRWKEAVTAIHMKALRSSISFLSASLRIFTIRRNPQRNVSGWSSMKQFLKGSHIRKLHLEGCIFQRCPKCIGQLQSLNSFRISVREVADAVSIVAKLNSLAYFSLTTDMCREEKKESIVIPGTSSGAFQALKEFIFHCPKASLTFEAGAMPKLEKLDIHSHFKMNRLLLPVGIQNLPAGTLKEILLEAHWDEAEEDWAASEWDDYPSSVEYIQLSTWVRVLWKQAFKRHHPDANIAVGLVCHYIGYDDGFGYAAGDEETLEILRQIELQLSVPVGLELSGLVDLLSLLHEDEDDEDEDEDEDEEDDEDEATSTDSSS